MFLEEPRVLALVPPGSDACLLWRNWWPAEEIRSHGYIYDWMYFENYKEDVIPALQSGKYNTVITPRFVWQETWMLQQFASVINRSNLTWIYEADDDMFSEEIIERNVAYNLAALKVRDPVHMRDPTRVAETEIKLRWRSTHDQRERLELIKLVDGLTVSTIQLSELARPYMTAPIEVIPNMMHVPWFKKHMQHIQRSVPPLTIGWSGGWRYDQDILEMTKAWANISKKYPDILFVLHGWNAPIVIDQLPPLRLRVLPWSTVEDYPAILKNIDIGCCSVADEKWNYNKSVIKWLEMSMAGSAVVASHALYDQGITDGFDGLLATTAEEWSNQIEKLILDVKLRKTIQANAEQTVINQYNINNGWIQWLDAWAKMMQYNVEKKNNNVSLTI